MQRALITSEFAILSSDPKSGQKWFINSFPNQTGGYPKHIARNSTFLVWEFWENLIMNDLPCEILVKTWVSKIV
jgi:hypothetical protein